MMSRVMREDWWSLKHDGEGPSPYFLEVSWPLDCALRASYVDCEGSGAIPAHGPPLPQVSALWAEAVLPRSADVALPRCVYAPRWEGIHLGLLVHAFPGEQVRARRELQAQLAGFVGEGTLEPFCPDADSWWIALLSLWIPATGDHPEYLFRAAVSALGVRNGTWAGGKTHFQRDAVTPRPGVPLDEFYNFHAFIAKALTEAMFCALQISECDNVTVLFPAVERGEEESRPAYRERIRKDPGSTMLRVVQGRDVRRSQLLGANGKARGLVWEDHLCEPFPGSFQDSGAEAGGKVWVRPPVTPESSRVMLDFERKLTGLSPARVEIPEGEFERVRVGKEGVERG